MVDFGREREWDSLLPLVAYLINHAVNTSIGTSPYAMLHGPEAAQAKGPFSLLLDEISPESVFARIPNSLALVEEGKGDGYVDRLRASIATLHRQARVVQQQQIAIRQSRTNVAEETVFDLGAFVLLDQPEKRRSKFDSLYQGPYKIIDRPSEVTYTVQAVIDPEDVLTCHADRLKKLIMPPDATIEDLAALQASDSGEKIVRAITDHRQTSDGGLEFQTSWADGDVTWEPYLNVKAAKALEEYLTQHSDLRLPAQKKRGRPRKTPPSSTPHKGG